MWCMTTELQPYNYALIYALRGARNTEPINCSAGFKIFVLKKTAM